MSEMEKCIECLILIFHRYAKDDGDEKTLRKKDLKNLLEVECPGFLKNQHDPKTVEHIMKDLDQNKDDRLSFEEFLPLVAGLAISCEKNYTLHQKKSKN